MSRKIPVLIIVVSMMGILGVLHLVHHADGGEHHDLLSCLQCKVAENATGDFVTLPPCVPPPDAGGVLLPRDATDNPYSRDLVAAVPRAPPTLV